MKVFFSYCIIILFSSSIWSQETILWSIKDSSNKTSYILGTYHQMGNSFIDSLPKIQHALYSCEIALFESLGTGENLRKYFNKRPDDFSYLNHLKKSDLAFLANYSSGWGVPLSKLRPNELLTKLQQEYYKTKCSSIKPTDKWDHMDNYLIHLADSNKISTIGLETDSLQTTFINSVKNQNSWEVVKKHIHHWVKNLEGSRKTEMYCQNVEKYMKLSFNYQFEVECGDNPMLKGRNENWMKQLPEYLSRKSCFIAVGLLHLYGACGIIQQLRNLGYEVSEVQLMGK